MVETLRHFAKMAVDGAIMGAEQQAISTTAQSLATIGFTVPADCTEVILYNADSTIEMRWHPTGTPTATFGHNIPAGKLARVMHHHIDAFTIRSDSGTPNLIAIYLG